MTTKRRNELLLPILVSVGELLVACLYGGGLCYLPFLRDNIETVAFGGYICTIFGWSLGGGLQVAYKGNYLVYRTI